MVDDGTACEIGIFYALMQSDPAKKGIVGLLTDLRSTLGHEGHGLNLFVQGCRITHRVNRGFSGNDEGSSLFRLNSRTRLVLYRSPI